MSAVNQMRQLDLHQKRINPSFVPSFNSFKEGLRVSFQQWDNKNKPKPSPRVKNDDKDGERRANKAQQSDDKRTDADKAAGLERYQKECKALGMWLEPAVFKKVTEAQKQVHKDKVRTMRQTKKTSHTANTADTTPSTPVTSPTPAAPAAPPTYAQAAQVVQTPGVQQVQQAMQANFPNSGPTVFTYMGRTYRSAMANWAYKASGESPVVGSLVIIRHAPC
jgi:hypothetical protein